MKNSLLFAFCIALVAATLIPSCTLPNTGLQVASPLRDGTRYELRRAVAANDAFEPWELRSVYFVLKPEAPPTIAGTRAGLGGVLSVRTTAYCHSESDHIRFGHLSASGRPLKYGIVRSAAADWSRFPMGTQFRIRSQPGVIYEVDDYGSALVGSNTIDIYCPDRKTMNKWGVQNCSIEVLHWGSFSESLTQLRNSSHMAHVRQMVRDIQTRLGGSSGRQLTDRGNSVPETAMATSATLLADSSSRSF